MSEGQSGYFVATCRTFLGIGVCLSIGMGRSPTRPAEAGHYIRPDTPNLQFPTKIVANHWELGIGNGWKLELVVGSLGEQLVQVEVMFPELATVVACRDLDDPRTAGCGQTSPECLLDG